MQYKSFTLGTEPGIYQELDEQAFGQFLHYWAMLDYEHAVHLNSGMVTTEDVYAKAYMPPWKWMFEDFHNCARRKYGHPPTEFVSFIFERATQLGFHQIERNEISTGDFRKLFRNEKNLVYNANQDCLKFAFRDFAFQAYLAGRNHFLSLRQKRMMESTNGQQSEKDTTSGQEPG